MSPKELTLYVDVTDFIVWRGHFTGIQRVVYSLAKEIISNNADAVLVVSDNGVYQRIDQNLDDIKAHGVKKVSDLSYSEGGHALNQRARHRDKVPLFVRKTAHPLTHGLRWLFKSAKPSGRKILHEIRELKGSLGLDNPNERIASELSQPTLLYGEQVHFGANDTLLVLGCLWDNIPHLDSVLIAVELNRVRLVICIYDLIPIYGAHTFGEGLGGFYSKYLFETLSVATTVLSISKATTSDIKKFIDETGIVSTPRIKTIRLGDSIPVEISHDTDAKLRRSIKAPFALSVGTIETRKNHVQIYISLKLAQQKEVLNKLPHIYIIGRKGWLSEDTISHFKRDFDIKNKVTILEDVSDEELAWFYKHASYSVYTSQYEGWGLPIAESLTYGTPVICSDTSSMQEIAPRLVKAVSPYDTGALLQAMLDFADKKTVSLAKGKIKAEYHATSWSDTLKSFEKELI
jgi:glycosyltransferase involved in cell wall biosynthesis